MSKSSTNSNLHPYLRGHLFWSKDPFWRSGPYSEKTKADYESWLNEMKMKETSLTRLRGNG